MLAVEGRDMSDALPAPTSTAVFDPISAFRLDGRVAIVTGASSGFGERFARVLRAAGASVVLAARRVDRLEHLSAEIGSSIVVPCDLSNPAEIQSPVQAALESFGRLDILVNNAGISHVQPALEEPLERFVEVLHLNLVAPFVLARSAASVMMEAGRGGAIVNIASILGLVGQGQMPLAAYAASKGGLVNLTRELGAQWARKGVRVNAIAPGWFETEMTADLFRTERGTSWVTSRTPMARAGQLRELDGALLFLASDASTFVTGHVLVVDGGWTAV